MILRKIISESVVTKFLSCIKISNIKILHAVFFVCLLLQSKITIRAQPFSDAGLWTTLTFEKRLNSNFNFLLTEEMRLKENLTRLNLFYTSVGFEYRITKNIRTAIVYRSIQRLIAEDFFSFRHRLQWDVTIKKKIRRFEPSYRHRLQAATRNIYSSETGYLPQWASRHKFQAKYELNKYYSSYFSVELRQQIRYYKRPESNNYFYRTRYQLGLDYKFSAHRILGLYYFLQDEFNINYPRRVYIIGLEYTVKF